MKKVTSRRIRIASVSKDDGINMATALKQANSIAQSFQGTLTKATVVQQIRHNSYYDVYVEVR